MPRFEQLADLLQQAEQPIEELMAMGGPIMWPLLAVSMLLWTLVLERYCFLFFTLPALIDYQRRLPDCKATRMVELAETTVAIQRYLRLIKTLSAILPMLGLLGTVTGIVETFDLIQAFGSAETSIIARGVSQALITTLAGLVMGLFGVGVGYDLNHRAQTALTHCAQI